MDYTIDLIDKNLAKKLIKENHYSHAWTPSRYTLGLFDGENLIGVAVYGFPVGRQTVKSITPNLGNKDVLELKRLWLVDEAPKNSESFFIGKTFDWLRKNTNIKVLVSYSDPMYNHLGTIYQATNWVYQGNAIAAGNNGYLHKINGKLTNQRSVCVVYKTIKHEELLKIDPNYERVKIEKKHRYIYILHKKDRKKILSELKHKPMPYPKYNLNSE